MLAAAGLLLAGCEQLSAMNPANWWHRQEGGKIAEQRPAPPGADQPYPNLSTVPPKPDVPDAEALKKLTDSLVADRTNAQHAAQGAPMADPSSPTASPSLFGVGTAPPPPPPTASTPKASGSPGAPVASASMPAVTAPPPPAAPPSPAPRKPVQSTPLEAPVAVAPNAPAPSATAAPASPPVAAPPVATAPAPVAPSATASVGTPPALPAAPPARPAVAGAAPVPKPAPAPMPAPSAGPAATIVFLEGASNLSAPAADEVKAFAAKRGNGTIAVTGYGESTSSDPSAQTSALNLGLSRAQSIVDALKAAGVPGTAIRVSAEASGRGASLNLIQ